MDSTSRLNFPQMLLEFLRPDRLGQEHLDVAAHEPRRRKDAGQVDLDVLDPFRRDDAPGQAEQRRERRAQRERKPASRTPHHDAPRLGHWPCTVHLHDAQILWLFLPPLNRPFVEPSGNDYPGTRA
ncbi:MAG: hypothetical protein M5U26_15865 [Planctomycetota bacterium]|nr:hypothetical protein [Planctomycetota bacterium]